MNNTYVDRGIIKWAPFDGLAGFNNLYKELKYRLNKTEKPILSEDQLYEMDIHLKKALHEKCPIYLTYYQDGYMKQLYGYVTEIDVILKLVYVNHMAFPLSIIMDLALDR
jgi:hypothetical protein